MLLINFGKLVLTFLRLTHRERLSSQRGNQPRGSRRSTAKGLSGPSVSRIMRSFWFGQSVTARWHTMLCASTRATLVFTLVRSAWGLLRHLHFLTKLRMAGI
eukprot:Lithocolla_globosa_v1_NODE_2816_length_1859_cov_5.540466.p2 type:complete len:102 gc:universal NODE_2816_length_1859_cov_5.540466:496-191(-)